MERRNKKTIRLAARRKKDPFILIGIGMMLFVLVASIIILLTPQDYSNICDLNNCGCEGVVLREGKGQVLPEGFYCSFNGTIRRLDHE